jgi:hypothetical protein
MLSISIKHNMLSVIMLSVIILSVIMLSVIILSVILLGAMALPFGISPLTRNRSKQYTSNVER